MSCTSTISMPTKKSAKIEVRAEPEWVDRVQRAAAALGLSASAFARMVLTQRMDQDGVPPQAKPRKPKADN